VDDHFNLFDGLLARVHGPLAFRFLLQPLMACVLAFRDGRRDAREGMPPFLWTVVRDASRRRALLRGAWMSIGSVMIVAALVDVLFQWMVFGGPRPGAGLMAAVVLAALPYSLVRGLVNRLFSRHTPGSR
jgi:hypothetical protein